MASSEEKASGQDPASATDAPTERAEPALLDVRDLLCPLPVLKARKAASRLAPGSPLRILATDPMAKVDIPHFCAEEGHALLSTAEPEPGVFQFEIQIKNG